MLLAICMGTFLAAIAQAASPNSGRGDSSLGWTFDPAQIYVAGIPTYKARTDKEADAGYHNLVFTSCSGTSRGWN